MSEKARLQLVEILKSSGADAWELTDTRERGWEFYLIRHRLDQRRIKTLDSFAVKVYRSLEDGKFLGSAGAKISPDASEEEMRRVVSGLLQDAAYVKNPSYTLNTPAPAAEGHECAPVDVKKISGEFLRALQVVPETETEDLNSYEIFVSEIRRRFLNSEGIDVTDVYPESMLEAVVNARKDDHEIELYRLYRSGSCDESRIIRDLSETLRYGRDRLLTVPTPALGKADVVFSTDAAVQLYDWFISRMSAAMVYRGISDWKIGQRVVPEGSGDRVTVRALRSLPNSSRNAAYDSEGAPVRDLTILEDGVAVHYYGSRQFSQYLGLQDSFIPGNFEIAPGKSGADTLRAGSFLEVVEFSDFQVDDITGDLAGEIRLAYWHDGDRVTAVSGGSISGSMQELAPSMRFSAERRQYNHLLIPELTRLSGVTVSGHTEE